MNATEVLEACDGQSQSGCEFDRNMIRVLEAYDKSALEISNESFGVYDWFLYSLYFKTVQLILCISLMCFNGVMLSVRKANCGTVAKLTYENTEY